MQYSDCSKLHITTSFLDCHSHVKSNTTLGKLDVFASLYDRDEKHIGRWNRKKKLFPICGAEKNVLLPYNVRRFISNCHTCKI